MARKLRALAARLIGVLLSRGPVVIDVGRQRVIFDPRTGRIVPQIAGADGAGEGEGEGGEGGSGEGEGTGAGEGGEGTGEGEGDKGGDGEPDWKSMARKHEAAAKDMSARLKKNSKERDDLAAKLRKIEDEGKSDSEKAIAAARDEATAEVTTKYETERRAERLELAVIRQATKGVALTLDGEEKTVKFADPDDALAHLERAIKRGDIEGDAIFGEDGKVDKDALTTALVGLLEDKPHLRATNGNAAAAERKGSGDADLGKGKGAGKSLEEMTPDDHLKAIQARS